MENGGNNKTIEYSKSSLSVIGNKVKFRINKLNLCTKFRLSSLNCLQVKKKNSQVIKIFRDFFLNQKDYDNFFLISSKKE